MPDIYRYFGFVFFFYSNEHNPIHVHVQYGEHESIFEIIMEGGNLNKINVREKRGAKPLTSKEEKMAEIFVRKYAKNIVEKWVNYFILNKRIVCTNVKTKIK